MALGLVLPGLGGGDPSLAVSATQVTNSFAHSFLDQQKAKASSSRGRSEVAGERTSQTHKPPLRLL